VNNSHFESVAQVWRALAGAPTGFKLPEITLVRINPDSHICPSGWTGFVRLGDSAVITTPNEAIAEVIEAAMPLTGDSLLSVLEPTSVLGPAALLYLDPNMFEPRDRHDTSLTAGDDPLVMELENQVEPEEAREADVSGSASPIFVTWSPEGQITAAAGYTPWLDRVAHISVLTRADHRGQGLGTQVASAAVGHAIANGLIPQWRATLQNEASLRVAAALGFAEHGLQISFQL
jgi:RimJ/RimL family protein N-acetyltransferase